MGGVWVVLLCVLCYGEVWGVGCLVGGWLGDGV